MTETENKTLNFDRRYMRMATVWAENSYCERRKVGALVVKDRMIISDGYNGTPAGFENICEEENNVTKPYVLHAEAKSLPNSLHRQASSVSYMVRNIALPMVLTCPNAQASLLNIYPLTNDTQYI